MGDYNDGLIPEPCLRLDFGFGQHYASVELGDGTGYVRATDELKAALEENAKLRDAMYSKAGKHALQHMDEDELRIWATQQSEHIDELKELCGAMFRYIMPSDKRYTLKESMAIVDDFADRCEEFGIEVDE